MTQPQSAKAPNPAQGATLSLCLAGAIACYVFIFLSLRPQMFWANPDFSDFYRAGQMVLVGEGARVYDRDAQKHYDAQLQAMFVRSGKHFDSRLFLFAPYSLMVFAPLGLLPYTQAEIVWYGLNVGVLLSLPFLLRRKLEHRNTTVALGILLPPFFLPIDLALMHGQPLILLLLFFTLAFVDFKVGHQFRSGCMLALATIKPQFVLPILIALMLAEQWMVLAGFTSACVVLISLAVALIGWNACFVGFPHAVLRTSLLAEHEHLWAMPNIRGVLHGLLNPFISDGHLRVIVLGSSALLVITAGLAFRNNYKRAAELAFSFAVVATLLANYHSYIYDLTLLLLPFLLVIDYVARQRRPVFRMAMAIVIATMFLVPLAHAPFETIVRRWFVTVLVFAVTLLAELVRLTEGLRLNPPQWLVAVSRPKAQLAR